MKTVIWKQLNEPGMEYCEITSEPFTSLNGHIITLLDSKSSSITYKVICDAYGGTRTVHVSCSIDGIKHQFSLNRSSEDIWFKDGVELPELQGLLDIDLGITPSTNTLPIRRLKMKVGESKEIIAVWVKFPELRIVPLSQRYTRLDDCTYLYESTNSNFKAIIKTDSNGFVTRYGDLWDTIAYSDSMSKLNKTS